MDVYFGPELFVRRIYCDFFRHHVYIAPSGRGRASSGDERAKEHISPLYWGQDPRKARSHYIISHTISYLIPTANIRIKYTAHITPANFRTHTYNMQLYRVWYLSFEFTVTCLTTPERKKSVCAYVDLYTWLLLDTGIVKLFISASHSRLLYGRVVQTSMKIKCVCVWMCQFRNVILWRVYF